MRKLFMKKTDTFFDVQISHLSLFDPKVKVLGVAHSLWVGVLALLVKKGKL